MWLHVLHPGVLQSTGLICASASCSSREFASGSSMGLLTSFSMMALCAIWMQCDHPPHHHHQSRQETMSLTTPNQHSIQQFCFVLCFDTSASRQQCIDYITTSARLSGLGATPPVQVSGGQIPPSAIKKKNGTAKSTVTSPSRSSLCFQLM